VPQFKEVKTLPSSKDINGTPTRNFLIQESRPVFLPLKRSLLKVHNSIYVKLLILAQMLFFTTKILNDLLN
jgi:hypothetical protein